MCLKLEEWRRPISLQEHVFTWFNLFQGIWMCHGRGFLIPSHIIQLCDSCIYWNFPISPTWWIFSKTTRSWHRKKHIHHSLEARFLILLVNEILTEHRSLVQECKMKSRDHSYRHVAKIAHTCMSSLKKKDWIEIVKTRALNEGLQFFPAYIFKGWSIIKGWKV